MLSKHQCKASTFKGCLSQSESFYVDRDHAVRRNLDVNRDHTVRRNLDVDWDHVDTLVDW